MRNIRLDIEYEGTAYHGWQIQPDLVTVEGTIKKALFNLTGQDISMIVAGRTDTGVHARQQVLNFRTDSSLPLLAFWKGTNALLPEDIAVQQAREVPPDWHARFNAIERHYRYRILIGKPRRALDRRFVTHICYGLDVPAMAEAAKHLVGRHDFTSFRSTHCGANSPVRELTQVALSQEDRVLTIDFKGNAFLRNMVRVIVGTLIKVGAGRMTPEDVKTILEGKDRDLSGPTAPAQGLTLWAVKYEG